MRAALVLFENEQINTLSNRISSLSPHFSTRNFENLVLGPLVYTQQIKSLNESFYEGNNLLLAFHDNENISYRLFYHQTVKDTR